MNICQKIRKKNEQKKFFLGEKGKFFKVLKKNVENLKKNFFFEKFL